MASWGDIAAQAPELTAQARGFLDAFVHKTLATLRRERTSFAATSPSSSSSACRSPRSIS